MIGAILVFLGVLAIVATYMYIVHSFLRASEEDIEKMEEAEHAEEASREEPAPHSTSLASREKWAH
jgi:hypothetical protein